MKSKEKQVTYEATNTYSTLNKVTKDTEKIWMVFHGMGYLSRFFIRFFEALDTEENYIIAPQAPSKYYQGKDFRIVGASWLTKENTKDETGNVLNYTEEVFNKEVKKALKKAPNAKIYVLGFSQGVSIASRFVAHKKIDCKQLVLHSGGIPKELTSAHFKDFKGEVTLIYGTEDTYLDEERLEYERGRALALFENRLQVLSFKGTHELNVDLLKDV